MPTFDDDNSYSVKLSAESLTPTVCARLDERRKLDGIALNVPVRPRRDGTWIAASGLSTRAAQSLRRRFKEIGLSGSVIEDEPLMPGAADMATPPPPSVAASNKVTEDAWGEVLPNATIVSSSLEDLADQKPDDDPRGTLMGAPGGPDLLSWFGDEEEVEEEREEKLSLEELLGAPPTPVHSAAPSGTSKETETPDELAATLLSTTPPQLGTTEETMSPPEPNPPAPTSPSIGSLDDAMGAVVDRFAARPSSPASFDFGGRPQSDAQPRKSSFEEDPKRLWRLTFGAMILLVLLFGVYMLFLRSSPEDTTPQPVVEEEPETEVNTGSRSFGAGVAGVGSEVYEGEAVDTAGDNSTLPQDDEYPEDLPSSEDILAAAELFQEGKLLCGQERFKECESMMEAVITLDPGHLKAYEFLLVAKTGRTKADEAKRGEPHPEPKVIVITPDTPRDLPDAGASPTTPSTRPNHNGASQSGRPSNSGRTKPAPSPSGTLTPGIDPRMLSPEGLRAIHKESAPPEADAAP